MLRILTFVSFASLLLSTTSAQPTAMLVPPDPVADGRFGKSVASVPDTDGDGHEDILIGAADDNVPGARKAYLFSGATGVLLHAFDPPDPTLRFGYPVSAVPDTDGDGRGDLLIGAIDETGPPISGRAYSTPGLPVRSSARSNRPTLILAMAPLDSRSQAYRTLTAMGAAMYWSALLGIIPTRALTPIFSADQPVLSCTGSLTQVRREMEGLA